MHADQAAAAEVVSFMAASKKQGRQLNLPSLSISHATARRYLLMEVVGRVGNVEIASVRPTFIFMLT